MARKYKRNWRRKQINKIKGKKKKKSYQSKLENKKIDTIVELRMKEISKAEVAKRIPKCIYRQFLNGTYTYLTNAFVSQVINHTGSQQEVAQIVKSDTLVGLDLVGGKRLSNEIVITGFALTVRFALKEDSSTAELDNATLIFSLVMCSDDWEGTGAPAPPSMEDTLPWYPFGYSPTIDAAVDISMKDRKIKNLIKSSISRKHTELSATTVTKKYYYTPKRPIRVQYAANDITGQCNPIKHRFYLSFRSNIPNAESVNAQPRIVTCLKTYYRDSQ